MSTIPQVSTSDSSSDEKSRRSTATVVTRLAIFNALLTGLVGISLLFLKTGGSAPIVAVLLPVWLVAIPATAIWGFRANKTAQLEGADLMAVLLLAAWIALLAFLARSFFRG